MSEKDNVKVKQKPSSAVSDTVLRGAANFRKKMQQRKGVKGSLRDQIRKSASAVKVNANNNIFKDQVKSQERNNTRSHDAQQTKKKAQRFNVEKSNEVKPKGKNYPTPKSAREPKNLTEDEIDEIRKRRLVFDTKVGGRSAKGGFQFRKPPRLGSDNGRKRRLDRIYSVDDSDEEEEREGAYGYGNN